MFGYIYITTDLETGKQYIGQKKSSKFLSESYVGSGTIIKKIVKYLKQNNIPITDRFKTELLKWCDSPEELNKYEIQFINEYGTKYPNGYNLANGGQFTLDSDILSILIKEAYKTNDNIGMKNKHQSDYQKQVVREYMKNRVVSEVSKTKMSNSHKGLSHSTYPKGSKFMYHPNKEDSIIVSLDDVDSYLSQGYILGRKPYSSDVRQKQREKYSKGTYVYKDTTIKFIHIDEVDNFINEGWKIGHPKGLSKKINKSSP